MKKLSIVMLLAVSVNSVSAMQKEEAEKAKIIKQIGELHEKGNQGDYSSALAVGELQDLFRNSQAAIECDDVHDLLLRKGLITCSQKKERGLVHSALKPTWTCKDILPDAVRKAMTGTAEQKRQ